MAKDDWRIRIELPEEHGGFMSRLGLELGGRAHELAEELEGRRLAVSQDDSELFIYAASRLEAERALDIVHAQLAEDGIQARTSRVERWLTEEERWDDEPGGPSIDEEVLAEGHAPWEVRVECESHGKARELADRLESEGYGVVRRWRYVIAGTATEEDARELARRVHGEVEAGGELVWEVASRNPFAIFGGLGGTGTPL